MTHEAKHLVLQLEARIERMMVMEREKRAEGAEGTAAIARAWADATRMALEDVLCAIPWVEEDARFAQARA